MKFIRYVYTKFIAIILNVFAIKDIKPILKRTTAKIAALNIKIKRDNSLSFYIIIITEKKLFLKYLCKIHQMKMFSL